METTRQEVADRAAQLLADGFVLIDLETTGLADDPNVEIIEVAVIDHQGQTLLDTLVKPQGRIPFAASRVNNITDDAVAGAPGFPEVYPELTRLLNDQNVLAYNYTFEEDVLVAACQRYNLPAFTPRWWCPMRAYQTYTGNRRYTKLTKACQLEGITVANAHRAVGDCIMTLALVKKMAAEAGPTIQPSLF